MSYLKHRQRASKAGEMSRFKHDITRLYITHYIYMPLPLSEFDNAEWVPLDLTWHHGSAFLDGVLLANGNLFDDANGVNSNRRMHHMYMALDPKRGTPQEVAERVSSFSVKSSLPSEQPVWRHRLFPEAFRTQDADHYLLSDCLKHGYLALAEMPGRFAPGLQEIGHGYWRDSVRAYYANEEECICLTDAISSNMKLATFPVTTADFEAECRSMATDGHHVWADGQRIASASDEIYITNDADYLVINGQVCWGRYGAAYQPLHQKDGTPLAIAHPKKFHMLAGRWGTDEQSIIVQAQQGSSAVWYYFYRIDDVDLSSFVVLNQRYAKDARHAWYLTGKTIRYIGDFRILRRREPSFDELGRVVSSEEIQDQYYAVDDCYVYAAGARLRGAHGPSFRHLGFNYFRDDERIYYDKKPLDVDVESFIVSCPNLGERIYSPLLIGDKHGPIGSNSVIAVQEMEKWTPFFTGHPQLQDYWWHRLQKAEEPIPTIQYLGHQIKGLDPASFIAPQFKLPYDQVSDQLCGDAHGIYWLKRYSDTGEVNALSTAPVASLRLFGEGYISDGKTIFFTLNYEMPKALRKVDVGTFSVLGSGWARDAKRVFYFGVEKKGIDPDCFRIEGCYAWDDVQLFCNGKPFAVNIPHTELKVPHPAFLLAGEKLFCGRRPVSTKRVHLPTLQFLDHDFARDQQRVYVVSYANLVEIDGADVVSFQVRGKGKARDDKRTYDAAKLRQ